MRPLDIGAQKYTVSGIRYETYEVCELWQAIHSLLCIVWHHYTPLHRNTKSPKSEPHKLQEAVEHRMFIS